MRRDGEKEEKEAGSSTLGGSTVIENDGMASLTRTAVSQQFCRHHYRGCCSMHASRRSPRKQEGGDEANAM